MLPLTGIAQVALPPVNLGLTSFEDALAGPGWLLEEIPNHYRDGDFKNAQGKAIPGLNELNYTNTLSHVTFISKPDFRRLLCR